MVGAVKRWLGIDVLERENLQLAKSLKSAHQRITELSSKVTRIDNATADALNSASDMLERLNSLTSEPPKPKIVATAPKAVSWKSFRSAAERASEPEREEA
jgi:prophage DNA circulation protein